MQKVVAKTLVKTTAVKAKRYTKNNSSTTHLGQHFLGQHGELLVSAPAKHIFIYLVKKEVEEVQK